jgi:hypothetical protein
MATSATMARASTPCTSFAALCSPFGACRREVAAAGYALLCVDWTGLLWPLVMQAEAGEAAQPQHVWSAQERWAEVAAAGGERRLPS